MQVKYHKIADISGILGGQSLSDIDYDTFQKLRETNKELQERLFSFTTLRAHKDGTLYLGVTHFAQKLLWRFDPGSGKFTNLNYEKIATKYDSKIHRSLEWDPVNKVFYGVASALHGENEFIKAPGSPIFSYDPQADQIESLGIPMPHEYTQTITFDPQRRLVYGFTYHTFSFYAFNVDTRETVFSALVGSIPHISAIDDDGGVWSTWCRDMHHLFKYDPDRNDIIWTRKSLPECWSGPMYPGAGPIDSMINGGDSFMYIGVDSGSIYRLDPRTVELEFMGRPTPVTTPRLPGLVIGSDGLFYGITGDDNDVQLFRFDRKTRGSEIIARVAVDDEKCFRPHDLAIIDNHIYIGETDHGSRSGYLWEIIL